MAFAAAASVAPFPSHDQHTYWLHAAAAAAPERLANDWLVATVDPVPVFTLLARLGVAALGDHFALMGWVVLTIALGLALAHLAWRITGTGDRPGVAWYSVVVMLHAVGLRSALEHLAPGLGAAVGGGIAQQTLMANMLVPATIGVLLVVALALLADGRHLGAGLCVGVAALVHPTYLLPAAALTVAIGWIERRARHPPVGATLASALVLGAALIAAWRLVGIAPDVARAGAAVLVDERLPHHTHVAVDAVLLLQAGAVVILLWRARATAVFPALAALTLVAVGGGLAAELLDDPRLRLAMPWRASVVLVPVATTTLAAMVMRRLAPRIGPGTRAILFGGAAFAAVLGLLRTAELHRRHEVAPDRALVELAARTVPADGQLLVPPDALGVRLGARVPVYVDEKSHPLRGDEVLAWRQRLADARAFHAGELDGAAAHRWLRAEGITHVAIVAPRLAPRDAGLIWVAGVPGVAIYGVDGSVVQDVSD